MASGKMSGRWQVLFTLAAIVVVAVVTGVVVWVVNKDNKGGNSQPSQVKERFTLRNADLRITDKMKMSVRHNHVIVGDVEMGIGRSSQSHVECGTGSGICLLWEGDRKMTMIVQDEGPVTCYNVTWEALGCVNQEVKDCVDLSRGNWYGGFEDRHQYWPMNRIKQPMAAYVATDSWADKYGGVLEPYFLSSSGFGIYIDQDVPLHLSFNEGDDRKMCMVAKFDPSPYTNINNNPPRLSYTVCHGAHVKAVHDVMSARFIPRPEGMPDPRLFRSPIWSTWAMFKKDINQSQVLQLARDIAEYGFSHSQLEIDDDWTPAYGDMEFTTDKFPDAKGMIAQLNQNGFRVTVWLHPFFNMDSEAFTEASTRGYLVRAPYSQQPALTSWWRGTTSGTLDVTNPAAVQWYLGKLTNLRNVYNISSYKFDAGEVAWLPPLYSVNVTYQNPNEYTRKWAELAYAADPDIRHQEVRVGAGSQRLPIFVRMLDRDSVWDYENGLRTLIPCALTFGLIGYPFILPDMIGGNAYDNSSGLEARNYPDAELFIRWIQLNTFLPSLQFSVVPWIYDETVVNISRKFTKLHEEYTDLIVELAENSTRTGEPIIRPLWWVDPQDQDCLALDSEYLLGNDLLVAPVLEQGQRSRDVYLPKGTWFDELRRESVEGAKWLRDYKAELDELPYFTRIDA